MWMGCHSDVRHAKRCSWMVDAVVRTGSVVVRKFGAGRAGEIAAHRFLSNGEVSPQSIFAEAVELTAVACAGADVLAVQDTTEINFTGRSRSRCGLGPGGDGKEAGFFIHPVIAVDVASGAVLGLADAQIWTRGPGKVSNRKRRCFEDKEAARWQVGMMAAGRKLAAAARITVVGDRESDIYPLFARKPEGADLIIRARHNRKLAGGGLLFEAGGGFEPVACAAVDLMPRKAGEKPRTAWLTVAAGEVVLSKPPGGDGADPQTVKLNLVVAEEKDGPLLWRLLTSLPVATAAEVLAVIARYRLRWRIEEVFRALKRDGIGLDGTQVESAHRLFNLSAIALRAAVHIIQLTDARDGSPRPATDVLRPEQAEAAAAIGKALEGKTVKQKNPHPETSLAHIAWIAARLGGWNCYGKPPGPKTIAQGWKNLVLMLKAFAIASDQANV